MSSGSEPDDGASRAHWQCAHTNAAHPQLLVGYRLVFTLRRPVCARAPSIAEVLATDHPNLGLARIETTCPLGPNDGCWLDVTFLRPPGGPAVDLPPALRGRAPEGASGTVAWLAAARAIGTAAPETTGVLGVFASDRPTGYAPSPLRVRLGGLGDDAPEPNAAPSSSVAQTSWGVECACIRRIGAGTKLTEDVGFSGLHVQDI